MLNWGEKSGILGLLQCLPSFHSPPIASTVQAPFSVMSLALAWAFPSHSFLLCLPPSFSQTPPYSCPPLFSFLLEVIFLKKFLRDFSLCCVFFFFSQFPLNSCAIHKSKLTSCAFLPSALPQIYIQIYAYTPFGNEWRGTLYLIQIWNFRGDKFFTYQMTVHSSVLNYLYHCENCFFFFF